MTNDHRPRGTHRWLAWPIYVQVGVLLGAVALLVCDDAPVLLSGACGLVRYGGALNGAAGIFSILVAPLSALISGFVLIASARYRVGWLRGVAFVFASLVMSWLSVASIVPLWS